MTLDFKKMVRNSIKKQMAIQHFECNVQVFKKDELPEFVMQKIQSSFGDSFCEDANYTIWFSGSNITKEIVEKTIFKIANKALGEAANSMNDSDLKMIDLGPGGGTETPADTPDDVESMTSPDADDANSEAIGDLVGTGDAENIESDDDGDEMDDIDDEGDEMDDLDESVESPEPGEKFVFLKVTMK